MPNRLALADRKHRDHNRAHWQRLRRPCARCGKRIDYDGPMRLPSGKYNPDYLVVGHKVDRITAVEAGWTLAQINDLSNTQPECLECSWRSGGELKQQRDKTVTKKRATIAAPEAAYW